ncbi:MULTISPECIES: DUF2516 family protein [unclassified Streptomyces]|uniref:DUF2516 family protein n=1 Tax=unclassified Streptomyces TaxID=2593676 RepID=UPI001F041377|nr:MULTISPECIES: DUF2516 family protein [unclassified Streptomyces]MCH0566076.1 DUF2516 family protein [Streptomyces sp. MUM 2J]MCH0567930.1 DUF2516 family protein [Streptomyces sp. MUM 136J]
MLIAGFSWVMFLLSLALVAFSGFALIDAAIRREDAYRAADKRTKPFWLIVLGLSFLVNVMNVTLASMWLLMIIGLVATIVYMVDVRPALRGMSGGRGWGRRGSSSDGPYGPWNGGR